MIFGRTSIIIPSRNERFLRKTINDVLQKAGGDIEVLAVLDGYWPDARDAELKLPDDKRLRIIHKGTAESMRWAINDAARIATGEFLLKTDAHCMFAPGFDVELKACCEKDWVVVPRRYSLDAERWCFLDNGKSPVDAHFLSYPYEPNRLGVGLHGTVWTERARKRLDIAIDEEMSSQGSCWFTRKAYWDRTLGPLRPDLFTNFVQEMQEIGLRCWLTGGKLMVNKRTWYAHLHKGKQYGRGYFISKQEMAAGMAAATDYFMNNRLPGALYPLRWLIERFSPVPSWPDDLDQAFAPR